jgi:hypothetical protein
MQDAVAGYEISTLRRLLLLTSDAHGLYGQFGFGPLGVPSRFMEVLRADIYQAKLSVLADSGHRPDLR